VYRLNLWLQHHRWLGNVAMIAVLSLPPIWRDEPGFQPVWVQLAVHLALVLPLLLRHRRPGTTAVILIGVAWFQHLARVWDYQLGLGNLALVVIVYTLVVQGRRRHAALAVSAIGVVVLSWMLALPSWMTGPAIVGFGIVPIFATAWVLGEFIHARRAYIAEVEGRAALAESERQALARAARAEERNRIARELHDVLAHTITVMVVNAEGAGLVRRSDPEAVGRTLETISATGRSALGELRRMLGMLHADEPPARPQPTEADLRQVVAAVNARRPGITLTVKGDEQGVPATAALQTYRIVQEALTNVIKHAPPDAAARVAVDFGPETIRIEVANAGGTPVGRPAPLPSSGRGLAGMRERVAMFGGTLDAGPTGDGGFRLAATLLLDGAWAGAR
jgi:signal transduction histidine kinase